MDSLPAFIASSIILLALSAFFSGVETAYTSLSSIKLKGMAADGSKRAEKVLQLCENYDKLLSTILIGNNIVNILYSTIAALYFAKALSESSYSAAISTLVVTITVLIFGEISPKNLAKEKAESFAMFAYPFIKALIVFFTPINYLFTLWKKMLLKMFKIKHDSAITEGDIITLVSEAEKEGEIDKDESEIIKSAITFGDLEVSSVMTPRVNVIAIDISDDRDFIYDSFRSSGFSRLPVYDDNIDSIKGIMNLKDYYEKVMLGNDDITSVITEATFISQHAKIDDVLRVLQKEKCHIAVVVDDYGGTAGIVTMEDIIEELVGEIYDERDKLQPEATVKSESGEYTLWGGTEISDLPSELGIPECDDYSTVAGWIINESERIPEEGDIFSIGDINIKINKVCENRIENVTLTKIINEINDSEDTKENKTDKQ